MRRSDRCDPSPLRPGPLAPLRVVVEPRRLGRRIQVLDTVLPDEADTEVSSLEVLASGSATTAWTRVHCRPHRWPRARCPTTANGGSATAVDRTGNRDLNADLTPALHRCPSGEWIGVDATTHARRLGHGTAHGVLADLDAEVGYTIQTLVIDAR